MHGVFRARFARLQWALREFARLSVARKVRFAALDLLGHGRSEGERGMWLEYGFVVEDVTRWICTTMRRRADKRFFIVSKAIGEVQRGGGGGGGGSVLVFILYFTRHL